MKSRLNLALALLFLLGTPLVTLAQQLKSVTIGVDGLHCSACSYSVEKSLYRLDFVQFVDMDLNERKAEVILKKDYEVNYKKLAGAVTNAGFSVRDFYLNLKSGKKINNDCLEIQADHFCLRSTNIEASNSIIVQIMGKKFLSKSMYKSWKKEKEEWQCECGSLEKQVYFAQVK